jgi:hypothetical protein
MNETNVEIPLTASQVEQLNAFLKEKDHKTSLVLRESKTLGAVEVELVDANGKRAPTRLLFPGG